MENKYLITETDLADLRTAQKEILRAIQDIKDRHGETDNEGYVTRKQAAKILCVSMATLHKMMNEGVLNFKKFGKSTRFLRSDILKAAQAA